MQQGKHKQRFLCTHIKYTNPLSHYNAPLQPLKLSNKQQIYQLVASETKLGAIYPPETAATKVSNAQRRSSINKDPHLHLNQPTEHDATF